MTMTMTMMTMMTMMMTTMTTNCCRGRGAFSAVSGMSDGSAKSTVPGVTT
jgi:hypothetical protein